MKCQYCEKEKRFEEEANKRIINKRLKNEIDIMVEIDKNNLIAWCDNLTCYNKPDWVKNSDCIAKIKINYCPMCGRKLERE